MRATRLLFHATHQTSCISFRILLVVFSHYILCLHAGGKQRLRARIRLAAVKICLVTGPSPDRSQFVSRIASNVAHKPSLNEHSGGRLSSFGQ